MLADVQDQIFNLKDTLAGFTGKIVDPFFALIYTHDKKIFRFGVEMRR